MNRKQSNTQNNTEALDCLRRPYGNPLSLDALPRSRPQMRFPAPCGSALDAAKTMLRIQITAVALAAVGSFFAPTLYPIVPLCALLVLAYLASRFRGHYLDCCTASPFPRRDAANFRKRHILPAGIQPQNILRAFADAVQSFFAYNPMGVAAPGLLAAPAGSLQRRVFLTTLAVFLLSVSGPAVLLSDLPESLAVVSPVLSLLLALVISLCAFPITLVACFIAASSYLRGGFAIRKHTTLARYWEAFLQDLDTSADQLERDAFFLGTVAADGSPVLFSKNSPKLHTHLQGTTGSGKTTYLMFLIQQYIRRGWSVVVIDLKSQTFELLETMQVCNRRLGGHLPLWHLSSRSGDSSHLFSIFTQKWWKLLTPAQKTNVLLAAIAIALGRQYGQSWFGDAAYTLVDVIFQKYPDTASFAELDRHMSYEIHRGNDPDLTRQVKTDGEHARLVIRRLAKQEFLNPKPSHLKAAIDNAVELSELFSRQGLLYCGFSTMLAPVESPEHARLVTSALCTAANVLRTRTRPVALVLDEWGQAIAPGTIELLLRMARSAGIHVVLSNQTAADLNVDGVDMTSTVEGNVAIQAWFQTNDRLGQQQIRNLGGEILTSLKDESTSSTANGPQYTVTNKQIIVDRWPGTRVAEVSAKPNHFILRIADDKDYSQYGGIPFEAVQHWIMSKAEYDRRTNSPWPAATAQTIVIGKRAPGPLSSPPQPVAAPKPTPSPVLSTGTLGTARRTHRAHKITLSKEGNAPMDFSWLDASSLPAKILNSPYSGFLLMGGRAAGWIVAFELLVSVAIDRFNFESRAPDFWQRVKIYVALPIIVSLLTL